MLQETIARLSGMGGGEPILICNEEQRFLAAEQMRVLGHDDTTILLEPFGRNTAPAIALAALHSISGGEDPLLLVLAADHHIQDVDRFQDAVRIAAPLAEQGKLVTFGIVPQSPETGYGYIRRGAEIGAGFVVSRFEEKPDRATAEAYIASGDYYWNSGMFMFRASRYLAELKLYNPAIVEACNRSIASAGHDMQFVRIDAESFRACPDVSIDYAVMEKTADAAVVPLDASWSDIGSWSALWAVQEQDGDGNAFRGDVLAVSTKNTLVRADGRLVALVGVEDLIVVETKDAILVAHKDSVQRRQGDRRADQTGRPERTHQSPRSLPAMGTLRFHRCRRARPGQADHRETRRQTVCPDASPSRRTLDRRPRHRTCLQGRRDHPADGESVNLYPARPNPRA